MAVSYTQLPYFIQGLIDQVTYNDPNSRWSGVGEGITLTFNFANEAAYGVQGFRAYTEVQKAGVRLALAQWGEVSGLTFVEVAASSVAQLTFFQDDLTSEGAGDAAAYAWTPTWWLPEAGDVHMNSNYFAASDSFGPGNYSFQTLLHEIGHAIGLKHTFETPALPIEEDTQTNTVLTYNLDFENAQALGIFDLAAVHTLYGVDPAARAGNNVYTLADRYVWDGAGIDTLDGSAETMRLNIRLSEGSWIWAGTKSASILAAGQAFLGYGTSIERAKGGVLGDNMQGNQLNNILWGNAGHDVLRGLAGADTLWGGAGNDTLQGGVGRDVLWSGGGRDTFRFQSAAEAGNGSGRDQIQDFVSGLDTIDLSAMDANTLTGGVNDDFDYIGNAPFTHTAGELRYTPGTGILAGDVNGDALADFQIQLNHLPALTQADLVGVNPWAPQLDA